MSTIYIKQIQTIINTQISEVWCFDPFVYVDLKKFKAGKSILLIYDFYKEKNIFNTANTADAVISISQPILDFYKSVNRPKLLLQHGLGTHFSSLARRRLENSNFRSEKSEKLKIGYVGNLLRAAMNFDIAKQIILEHNDKEFHFWGPSSLDDNNVSPTDMEIDAELTSFLKFLRIQKNVFLHGVIIQSVLSQEIFKMDLFLFLYSAKKDINGASNSHKLIEYLSTGKSVVSTYVSNYSGSDLLEMTEEENLPVLFKNVTDNIKYFNSINKQNKRIKFALENTYSNQIDRIQHFIYKEGGN